MLEILDSRSDDYDGIISVGEVTETPSVMKRLVGNSIERFCPEIPVTTHRQSDEPAYFPHCVAFITKTSTLLEEGSFYPQRCTYYRIERYQCHDIDDIYDLLSVEAVMKYEWGIG